jgi:hypothetical protein
LFHLLEEKIKNKQNKMKEKKPPVDFTKTYANAHKTFTALEATAMVDQENKEERMRQTFERNKHEMNKSRNPMVGESTPRNGSNEVVMNPNWSLQVTSGGGGKAIPRHAVTYVSKPRKTPVGKIGVDDEMYDSCLGNKDINLTSANPVNLHDLAKEKFNRTANLKNDQELLRTCKMKVHAERKQKELESEARELRRQADFKEKESLKLRETFCI